MRTTLLTAALAPAAALAAIQPRNFVFIIPDGFGPAAETLARTYEALAHGGGGTPQAPVIEALPLDALEAGHARTHSANNLVTDSAAAGTALATGAKTRNGVLGLDAAGRPVGSVLEAAKLAGLRTGLVVTSIVNHATPAAFSAHARDRNAYAAIAAQQVGRAHPLNQSVDVLLGGGACHFKPAGAPGSCRPDAVDLLGHAAARGYTVAQDRAGFDALPAALPLLGLFNNDGDLAYEVDRLRQPAAEREPSLAEMTDLALRALAGPAAAPAAPASPPSRVRRRPGRHAHATDPGEEAAAAAAAAEAPGFFLMIEASRIDHAAHAHDGATLLGEVQAYHDVVGVVRAWIDAHPDTAMVSVADHETGGLTLPAGYDPRALAGARQSAEHLAAAWAAAAGTRPRDAAALRAEVLAPYGVADAAADEVAALLGARAGDFAGVLVGLLNRRAGLAWSTGGHSAVDTALYAYAAGAMGAQLRQDLAGGLDNTQLPRYVAASLGLDLDEATRRLRAVGGDWIP